jgi:colanic acid biosynthesis glycosyl transferase WcaI
VRILFITQIYAPEMGAQANRITPLARFLAVAGHEVFVATGMPNYPDGIVFPSYRGHAFLTEESEGVTVIRTASFTAPRNQSKARQLLSYLSFVPTVFYGGLHAWKVDAIIVTSPPIFPALSAMALARLRGSKMIFDIRDLWPDEIVACGAAREGSAGVRLVRWIERRAYARADLVTCTTPAIADAVVERGVPREKILQLPNGADMDVFRPLARDNMIASKQPFGDKFVVMYSGLLGIKHGVETILDAAARMRDEPDILFYLVGGGARRDALVERVRAMRLENVVIAGERSVLEIPYLLARADICVACLLPKPYLEKIIPVKIFEYMACEKPIVASIAGEGGRVLQESRGGIVVPPGDADAMVSAIRLLRESAETRAEMGRRGRAYVEANYSRKVMARRLLKALEEICPVPAAPNPRPVEEPDSPAAVRWSAPAETDV